jgi:Coenzyme PQQ synthesis protein D (PqqD)
MKVQSVSMGDGCEIRTKGGAALSSMAGVQLFVRSRSVVSRTVGGETLIVPVRAKVGDLASIYSFNQTASLIWKLLESARTPAELGEAVAREYGIGQERAEQDVSKFLSDMFMVGLIEMGAAEQPAKLELAAAAVAS